MNFFLSFLCEMNFSGDGSFSFYFEVYFGGGRELFACFKSEELLVAKT